MSAVTVAHRPWCDGHLGGEEWSSCARIREAGAAIEVLDEDGQPRILLWQPSGPDPRVTPAQARQLAEWLVEAANIVEGATV